MNREALIQDFFNSANSMARIGIMQHKHIFKAKNMLPHTQMSVLFAISYGGANTVKQLSELFGMTSSAGTQLVNKLVQGDYLSRKVDAIDRRKTSLHLTQKAKKMMAEAREHRIKKMIQMFEPLTDKELKELLRLQAKIVERWKITNKNK